MGISVRMNAICICDEKKKTNGEYMAIVGRLSDNTHIEYILRCPLCGKRINVSVRLTYTDAYNGVRVV